MVHQFLCLGAHGGHKCGRTDHVRNYSTSAKTVEKKIFFDQKKYRLEKNKNNFEKCREKHNHLYYIGFRHGIKKGEERQAMREAIVEWFDAKGPHRQFMGGREPGLGQFFCFKILKIDFSGFGFLWGVHRLHRLYRFPRNVRRNWTVSRMVGCYTYIHIFSGFGNSFLRVHTILFCGVY